MHSDKGFVDFRAIIVVQYLGWLRPKSCGAGHRPRHRGASHGQGLHERQGRPPV